MLNLISRRQYNDRRKLTAGLCEEIHRRIAGEIDGGEDHLIVDSKPIEVCMPARSIRCALRYLRAPTIGTPNRSGRCASASSPTPPNFATSPSSSETTPRTWTGCSPESSAKSARLPFCNTSIKPTTNLLAKSNMRYFNSVNRLCIHHFFSFIALALFFESSITSKACCCKNFSSSVSGTSVTPWGLEWWFSSR